MNNLHKTNQIIKLQPGYVPEITKTIPIPVVVVDKVVNDKLKEIESKLEVLAVETKFKCTKCPFTSTSKSGLTRHKNQMHTLCSSNKHYLPNMQ